MKKSFLMGVCATLALAVTACGREQASSPGTELRAQMLGKAPAWSVRSVDGAEVKSSDFKGKVLIVDFWATWCPPCKKEIPEYIAWKKKYADRGLEIVGVSLDEQGPAYVKAFSQRMNMNYPVVMGNEAIVGAFGGIEGLPTTFIIDREGNVRHMKMGLTDPEAYEKLIASLL